MQNSHDKLPETTMAELRFVNETPGMNGGYPNGQGAFIMGAAQDLGLKRSAAEAGFGADSDEESDTSDLTAGHSPHQARPGTMTQAQTGTTPGLTPGKKTKGRVKIRMEFIDNKLRRYTTFSKRKTGIMKKAYELSTLTGTQVMLLVASETGHVYTFATRKLQPMITSESGKALIQTCLNSPESPPMGSGGHDQRMNPTGFEEPELSYAVDDDQLDKDPANLYSSPTMVPMNNLNMESLTPGRSITPQATVVHSPPAPPPAHNSQPQHLVKPPQAHSTPTQQVPPPPLQQMQVQPSRASPSPQQPQTISLTTYMPSSGSTGGSSSTTTSSNNNKPQNLSMQQITAFIPQSGGLPPGTPIAIGSLPQSQQNGSTAQQVFRLPTQGQVISVPVSVPSSSSSNTENSSTGTRTVASTVSPPASSVSATPGSAPPGTIMYHTPQGVVYAAASASTLGALPEYLFNLQQSQTAFVSPDQQGGGTPAQQFITIPLPVSLAQNTQLLQPVLASSNSDSQSREMDKGRK